MKQIVNSTAAPAPIGPYNQAVLAGNTLYVSGQIAIDVANDNQLVTHDIEAETRMVMQNLEHILKQADMHFGNIVKCTIFIRDMGKFAQINSVYGSFFTDNFPARETVEVSCLPKNVNIEISCIAVK